MSLESFLSSRRTWILAVQRGYKFVPGSDTVYYKYSFHFSSPDQENPRASRTRGFLIVESCTQNGKTIVMRDGINQKKVTNPFVLVYTNTPRSHAFLKCSKLHAHTMDSKVRYDSVLNPPIVFSCQRKRNPQGESFWQISGSLYDTRAFFTPNLSFHDHFGYMSLLANKVRIHVTPQQMSFHILAPGSYEILVCSTVDESKLQGEDEDFEEESDAIEKDLFDLENALLSSSSVSISIGNSNTTTSTSSSTGSGLGTGTGGIKSFLSVE